MNQEWLDYKREVDEARSKIKKANADLELLKSKCKCTETRPRQTLSYGGKYLSYKTTFDECVVCLRIYNVKTDPKKIQK